MSLSLEKVVMLLLFPLITLALFAVAALLGWVIGADPFGVF